MNQQIEEFLKSKILPELENSRGGFDKIHTLETVEWIKKIIQHSPELQLDRDVLIIAAYAHDWGYAGIFEEDEVMTNDKIDSAKKQHMNIGEAKIRELLNDDIFSLLTDKQKERCVHLVSVHDEKYKIKDSDELVLAEADILSGTDIKTEKPKLDSKSNKAFMDSLLNVRLPKFLTEYSKQEAKRLIQERNEYYEKLSSEEGSAKNAIILHGTGDKASDFWFPYVKNELEKRGYNVWLPDLPNAEMPNVKDWLSFILENGKIDEETVLIGHSAGAQIILSVLENIDFKVKLAILVSGYSKELPKDINSAMNVNEFNWNLIRPKAEKFIFINSDNDPWGCDDKQGKIMHDHLGGEQIVLHEGHMGSTKFNQPYKEFPLILKLVDKNG